MPASRRMAGAPTPGWGPPPRPWRASNARPLMGSVMRSAVNHSSISRDRLSLPETIYWIPRSKWAFFPFSPGSGAIQRECVRLLFLLGGLCFLHLLMKTASCVHLPPPIRGFPECLPKLFPPLVQLLHKTHQLFPATEPGREGRRGGGGRQGGGGGGGEEGGTYLKKLNPATEIKKRG